MAVNLRLIRQPVRSGNHGTTSSVPLDHPHLKVETRSVGGRVTVHEVSGEVDIVTAPLLWDVLRRDAGTRAEMVVADLSGVTFFSAAGIPVLLRTAALLRTGTPRFVAVSGTSPVRRVLRMTGCLGEITVHPRLADALRGVLANGGRPWQGCLHRAAARALPPWRA
jgi:anti-sigma B factor antagonist